MRNNKDGDNMFGAIIGDIVGSTYEVEEVNYWIKNHSPRPYAERIKIMDKTTLLFKEESIPTDDTCWTLAILSAIINGDCDYETYLREYGEAEIKKGPDKFGRPRFGPGSMSWLEGKSKGHSLGNGGAMRISPIGFLFDNIEQIKEESYRATIPTHNTEEALKSAEAVAITIYLLRIGMPKEEVKDYIEKTYYNLDYNLEELRHNYTFKSKAKNSVPIAIYCFFEGEDFDDSIRKAISIGGDSDTIASITGAIAESYYGVPDDLKEKARTYLDENANNLLDQIYEKGKRKTHEI